MTYSYNGGVSKPAVVYVDQLTTTKYRFTVFLNNWDNEGLTGVKDAVLSQSIFTYLQNSAKSFSPTGNIYPLYLMKNQYSVEYSYASAQAFKNNIIVTDDGSYYHIRLDRVIDSQGYASTFKAFSSTIEKLSEFSSIDKDFWFLKTEIDAIRVSNSASTYNYSLVGGSIPTPTPTPESTDFTLSLSPQSAAVGDPVIATLAPAADAPTFTHVMWEYECTNQEEYDYRGGGWYRWNDTASTYSDAVTLADVCTYNFTSYTVGEGLVSCAVFDLTDGFQEVWSGTERAYFGTNAYLCDLSVVVRAASTGYLISGATAKITNARSGEVYNEIPLPIMAGIPFPVYRSQYYYVEVVADGYITENKSVYIPNADTYTVDYSLSLGTSPPPDNTYLRIFVDSPPQSDGYRRPISGAIVQVGSQFKSSDSGGCTVFTVASNTTHSYTVTASGYETATGSVAVGTTLTDVNVHLIESGTASGTPTPATTSAPGSITSHREAMRESMNGLYGNMPTYVGFAFFLLFFVMMKRGMK